MSNMSYCRFENTQHDLQDCEKHLLDDDLNQYEVPARDELIATCRRIVKLADRQRHFCRQLSEHVQDDTA